MYLKGGKKRYGFREEGGEDLSGPNKKEDRREGNDNSKGQKSRRRCANIARLVLKFSPNTGGGGKCWGGPKSRRNQLHNNAGKCGWGRKSTL